MNLDFHTCNVVVRLRISNELVRDLWLVYYLKYITEETLLR